MLQFYDHKFRTTNNKTRCDLIFNKDQTSKLSFPIEFGVI